ncbi:hypothetical protein V8F20_005356 [Naviculisporaceae sp. PSN 640]
MDLLPDVGTWLLRSVRRTPNGSDNPISVVERLNSLPHPLRNADKDTLVGAVLSLGPSLQLALHMLMELLPEDESRGRLGEVLCPTLGHLQRSLEETLSYLEPKRLLADQLPVRSRTPVPRTATAQSRGEREPTFISDPASRKVQSAAAIPTTSTSSRAASQDRKAYEPPTQRELPQVVQPPVVKTPAPRRPSPPRIEDDITLTNNFTGLQQPKPNSSIHGTQHPPSSVSQYSDAQTHLQPTTTHRPSTPNRQRSKSKSQSQSRSRSRSRYSNTDHPRRENPAADLALMKELRAEMRVNAAIQVAVDSLEFADGQMKIVRDVHRLHGSGSFELLQKHFYEGYNRILFRALELEQREFDSPSGSPVGSPVRSGLRWQDGRQADDGDEGYEGSGGLVSSPTKITVGSGSERSGSPLRRQGDQTHDTPGRHLQPMSQSTPGAPNVTPEHINTSYNHQQAPPPLILFNSHQTEPISLPPLPPLHSQSGSGERPRPQTANPGQANSGGMRTRWDDAALARNGRPLARRNTVQGQDSSAWSGAAGNNVTSNDRLLDANTGGAVGIPPRPRGSLKRRLSLAEELALVGEDSDEEEEEEDDGEDDQNAGVENKNVESSSDSDSENDSKNSSSEEDNEDDDDDDDDDESEDEDSASDTGEQQPAKTQPVVAKTAVPVPRSAAALTAPRSIPRAPASTVPITTAGTSPVTGSDLEARRKSIGLQGTSRLPRPQSSMSRPGTPLGRPQTPLGRPQTPRVVGR